MTHPAGLTIAPVRKTIRVNTTQAHAFEVFTSRMGRWWPKSQDPTAKARGLRLQDRAAIGRLTAARRPDM